MSAGQVALEKVSGVENPADLGTKTLPKASIQKILAKCGFVSLAGRSRLALKADV